MTILVNIISLWINFSFECQKHGLEHIVVQINAAQDFLLPV